MKTRIKPSLIFALVFMCLAVYLAGCAGSFRTDAYKTLASGAAIYEAGYPTFVELHQMGLISDADKAEGKALAVKYWAAYHAATDALIAYDAVSSADNEAKVRTAMDEAAKWLAGLSAYIQPFISRGVK